MRHFVLLILLLVTAVPFYGNDLIPEEQENFHLFLLVGQSNMAGRGEVSEKDLIENPRVLALGKDLKWAPAVDPLHFDKPIAGVGLGKSFGLEIAKARPGITVGLIPCAVGGSPIRSWEPGGYHEQTKTHPWDDMVPRVREALKSGTLKGILWHQGESDSNEENAPLYQGKMLDLVKRFRKEFEAENVPFICGQMGIFEERPWNEYKLQVDKVHQTLPAFLPHTGFVSAKGLGHKGDHVHFNAAAYRTLGQKFAKEYLHLERLASGSRDYHSVSYPPSEKEGELSIGVTHTLWIPNGVKILRGIIVHQHGCGTGACAGGATAAYDLHWQALARKWDCALLGPRYHQMERENCRDWCDPRNGSGAVFVKALEDLAAKSGHPEVAEIPWCLWGHSGGGFWASLLQMEHPEKIAAIWFQSGTAHSRWVSGEIEKPDIPAAAMEIPMVANPGFGERGHKRFKVAYSGCFEMVKDYRSRGGLIAFAPDPLSAHDTRDSRYLAIPFFDAVLAQRLPDTPGTGALKPAGPGVETPLHENYVDLEDPLSPSQEKVANWLPNSEIAAMWAEFVKKGEVGDTTPPPAPTGIEVNEGVVIWDAEADFESGIREFVIRKDGQEIGRVPTAHKKRFGRPLFQAMSYHDTPEAPLPEMIFRDAAISAGEKITVHTVNSVGLESGR
ncbi:MAG: sialate O-acetylesterase [Verrucomicrobiales bacterium]|nr:sialate O-acetylesterase [Verrucomicrobiales bacterium]